MAGLTLTIITGKATSLNYGETVGNVSVLKKLTLADGSQITYISDKAIKYDMRRKGKEEKGWKLLDEKIKEYVERNKRNKKALKVDVDSFGKELVKNYEEFDLFGGLFTKGLFTNLKVELSYGDSVKRVCPVKVTYAFSVSKFSGDMNFLNNIDAYNRYIKHIEDKPQAIANSEEHSSHYVYTVTIDLDRIGVWEKEDGSKDLILDDGVRAKRVSDLLDIVKTLDRQIKGRWENLSPVFVIGGVFSAKHPFFINGVEAKEENGKIWINVNRLRECAELVPERDKLVVGMLSGTFTNEEEIRNAFKTQTINEAFERLKDQVREHYGVS